MRIYIMALKSLIGESYGELKHFNTLKDGKDEGSQAEKSSYFLETMSHTNSFQSQCEIHQHQNYLFRYI